MPVSPGDQTNLQNEPPGNAKDATSAGVDGPAAGSPGRAQAGSGAWVGNTSSLHMATTLHNMKRFGVYPGADASQWLSIQWAKPGYPAEAVMSLRESAKSKVSARTVPANTMRFVLTAVEFGRLPNYNSVQMALINHYNDGMPVFPVPFSSQLTEQEAAAVPKVAMIAFHPRRPNGPGFQSQDNRPAFAAHAFDVRFQNHQAFQDALKIAPFEFGGRVVHRLLPAAYVPNVLELRFQYEAALSGEAAVDAILKAFAAPTSTVTPDVLQVVGIMKTATDVAIPAMRVPKFQGHYLVYVALKELDGISHDQRRDFLADKLPRTITVANDWGGSNVLALRNDYEPAAVAQEQPRRVQMPSAQARAPPSAPAPQARTAPAPAPAKTQVAATTTGDAAASESRQRVDEDGFTLVEHGRKKRQQTVPLTPPNRTRADHNADKGGISDNSGSPSEPETTPKPSPGRAHRRSRSASPTPNRASTSAELSPSASNRRTTRASAAQAAALHGIYATDDESHRPRRRASTTTPPHPSSQGYDGDGEDATQ